MSSEAPPIKFQWDGQAMRPAALGWQKKADKAFVIGEEYFLSEYHERSHATHAHYFAVLHEAWQNLPADLALRFPTTDHLRRYALIKAGYADSQHLVCRSESEAQKMAAFIAPIDEFGIVEVRGNIVTRYTAKSQSYRAMGKEEFARSKEAVLAVLAEMIGTTTRDLNREAGKAA